MFAIKPSSGELYVNDVIDREHVALIHSHGVLHIIVKVSLLLCSHYSC